MKTKLSVLPVLLLLAAPAAVQAQFQYSMSNGALTITNYVGTAGNLKIPPELYVDGTGFEPVTSIGSGAFAGNATLTGVTIAGSVTTIGSGAFADCQSLSNATLSNGLVSIGNSAFQETLLTNITIPGTVTNLGQMVFYECPLLTNVVFANGFTSISMAALAESSALLSVTIAGSVTNIGEYAFVECSGLRSVYFAGNCPIVDETSFEYDTEVTIYYLPDASGWADFDYYNTGLTPVLWNPSMQSGAVQSKHFGFNITGTAGIPIKVESSANLNSRVWTSLQTCTLTNGSVPFSDPSQVAGSACYCRISSP